MAETGAALRAWVASTRLTAGLVTGRTVSDAGVRPQMLLQPLSVVRPDDLLVLEFQFVNLRRSGARLVRANASRPAYLIAVHQFQSVGEEAFPEITDQSGPQSDPNLKGRPTTELPPGADPASLPSQARVRAADTSRTVHVMPTDSEGIDWTLAALLRACTDWPLYLDGSAQPDSGSVRYKARVRLGWIARDLRMTATMARDALGVRQGAATRAQLDASAAALAASALASVRRNQPAAGKALARRASSAVRRSVASVPRGSPAHEAVRIDQVIAAIYVRAQASRRVLIDIQRRRVADALDLVRLPSEIFIDFLRPDPPAAHETAIEMPYRLIASPLKTAGFAHALAPVDHDVAGRGSRTELWHSRMGTRVMAPGGVDIDDRPGAPTASGDWHGEKLRFIWSPDYPGESHDAFRKPLDRLDRQMLVKLTAGFDEVRQDGR
ncbi:MAG: hypothetical protein ACRCUI_01440, partial [Polymorphobacter sp.]